MAFGDVARDFEESKGSMFAMAPIQPNLEKIELTSVFRQEAVAWDSKQTVAPAVQVSEKPAINPAITEDVALAGNSLRNVSGVTPSSGVVSDMKQIGTEIGKDMGELGQSLFNLFGNKPQEPDMQMAAPQPQQRFSTFGL